MQSTIPPPLCGWRPRQTTLLSSLGSPGSWIGGDADHGVKDPKTVPTHQTPCQKLRTVHIFEKMFVKCQINATFAVRFPKGLPKRIETQLLNKK